MSNKTNVSTPAKHGAPATTYNPITPPATPSTASPVQGAASDDRQAMSRDDMQALCKSDPAVASDLPLAAASSASGAKGAAVKPWQDRARERWPDFAVEQLGQWATTECKDAEIADWRALAERAQAAQPSGAVARFKDCNIRQLVNDLRDIAFKFHATQQLRERIAGAVGQFIATPAPEQEAAQVGAVHFYRQKGRMGEWMRITAEDLAALKKSPAADCFEYQTLYTAPVAQEAEQPEGDSSHVMRPFGAPAGQHDSRGVVLPDGWRARIGEMREASYTISQYPEIAEVVFDSVLNALDELEAEQTAVPVPRMGGITIEQAINACRSEYVDAAETKEREDEVYNEVIDHCIAAIRATATNTNQRENLGAANTNKGGAA